MNCVICMQNVKSSHLKDDNFAIISLEVECPCGSDEAVGLTHDILPKPSDQSQGVQQVYPRHHGLQLEKRKTSNTENTVLS